MKLKGKGKRIDMTDDDLELKDLEQFYGTQNYYESFLGTKATDGIKYIANNGYSWLVTDCIVVIKTELKDNSDFFVINLKLKEKNNAEVFIMDGNGKILHTQIYEYTDAKRELTLYFQNNVLMLSGEY
jgi:hypothetical protein